MNELERHSLSAGSGSSGLGPATKQRISSLSYKPTQQTTSTRTSRVRQASKSELTWAAKRQPVKKKPEPADFSSTHKPREWPPSKYKDIEGTGYGTKWVPPKAKQPATFDELSSTLRRASSARNLNRTPSVNRNAFNQSLDSTNRSMNASVTDLQGEPDFILYFYGLLTSY